ncbi:hypothetical protein L2E82_14767 [Cichorium intybus]|uniref:Uncharacterized protein n=1 Tax=Cichorium intybus TaxID=13427 RepID=A0ACB9F0A8_CICIN|nr:hypothetical protein L2E82_14767 [Cichorium intybus]
MKLMEFDDRIHQENNQQPNASSSLNTIEYYLDDHSGSNAITSAQSMSYAKLAGLQPIYRLYTQNITEETQLKALTTSWPSRRHSSRQPVFTRTPLLSNYASYQPARVRMAAS